MVLKLVSVELKENKLKVFIKILKGINFITMKRFNKVISAEELINLITLSDFDNSEIYLSKLAKGVLK